MSKKYILKKIVKITLIKKNIRKSEYSNNNNTNKKNRICNFWRACTVLNSLINFLPPKELYTSKENLFNMHHMRY